ncbi:carbohydrate ABC transporter permease [Pseudotabrizicola sediminis]|uniref:sn-glycerol-3-phosphate transport system permease protein UgpE n=1 Tax=Pseudotabrizicola sediminis TaxID=2486418 RepID=A0ABY2KGI1_9RHOB|nr:carbohydrate ABC transporter permease [Pseudotabrizicola sediminis]TGD41278.1 carbohydrate ABC transporter permease [Pseudotabrizicola sediminis]
MSNLDYAPPAIRQTRRALIYMALIALSGIILAPFLMIVVLALSSPAEVFAWPPVLIPDNIQWQNFSDVFRVTNFGRAMFNTFVIATVSTIGIVLIDGLAGYAFAKMRFPGRTTMFLLILATLMVPVHVTIIPLFIMFRNFPLAGGNDIFGNGGFGILNSYPSMVLPFLATAYGTYLMTSFMRMLPDNLVEAARMDGAHEFAIFWKIYLPLAAPALTVIAMFNFTAVWNEFLVPLVMTSTADMKVIQTALADFSDQETVLWNLLMAAVLISILPLVLMFIVGQKHLVRGVAVGGTKG